MQSDLKRKMAETLLGGSNSLKKTKVDKNSFSRKQTDESYEVL
jgi:hypothetical protein